METVEPSALTIEGLAAALRSVDPRVVLVPARVFRRVVRGWLGIRGPFRHAPRWSGLAIPSQAALLYAGRDELGLAESGSTPEHLILLIEPEPDAVEGDFLHVTILSYWRALFHARVQLALLGSLVDEVGPEALHDRIEALGHIEFEEARTVLVEDSHLTLPADDFSTYVQFAATYLELHFFRPQNLPDMFPAIRDHAAVFDLLSADIDAQSLYESTRLPWAVEPPAPPPESGDECPEDDIALEPRLTEAASPEQRRWNRLRVRAELASQKGNSVRAAILRAQAACVAPVAERAKTIAKARAELDKLCRRLKAALGFDEQETQRWRAALPAFLEAAGRGHWSSSARMLYDLQKVAIDCERPTAAINLWGWVWSLGGHPLTRALPDLNDVRLLSHLRAVERRVQGLRVDLKARQDLESLIARAIRAKESSIRQRFGGRIRDVLDRVSLVPTNLPEETSRRKLVEELLDLIVERGYLRIGDLRDAISRNQNKLPDLAGPGEFLRGDRLLRADAELERALDGVYHRGEIYLRGLQRASSLAFGTHTGRWLTRYFALPFGAAFIALEGLQHIVGPIVHLFGGVAPHFFNLYSELCLAALLVGVLNFPSYRQSFFHVCQRIWLALKAVLYDAPTWLLDLPLVRQVVNSRTFELGWNWVGKPFVLMLVLMPFVEAVASDWDLPAHWGATARAVVFLSIAIVINSRPGRLVEEIAADGATRLGQRLWRDLIPSVFRGIMDFFKAGLEAVERVLYTVDEWLRFRAGDRRLKLAGKAVVGLVWGAVAYVARIYVNLLIEPQVNPIKHFPVVTISHKIILTASPQIFQVIRAPFMPLGAGVAAAIAGPTLFLLPGVFGFLVWELKENWRLYAANRAPRLRPVPFGHHGETLSRLLRRGFHSGTVPKLFFRLRRADRMWDEGLAKARLKLSAIHHAEDGVRRFVDRSVVYLLERSRSMGSVRPMVGCVHAATNRIIVGIRQGVDSSTVAELAFEESDRRLRLRFLEMGWLADLETEPRRALVTALAGLCAFSDVDLVISPDDGLAHDAKAFQLTWSSWVAAWQDDVEGRGHPSILPEGCAILPEPLITEPSTDG